MTTIAVDVLTAIAFCRLDIGGGEAGALNLKSPIGGAAYLMPKYWFTPDERAVPWY